MRMRELREVGAREERVELPKAGKIGREGMRSRRRGRERG